MTIKYRPEIDGVRSIAVMSVVFYHAGVSGFSGGYVGVDIFFVISGYLITLIISREIENNNFSIADFYERRIRRIIPALYFVMACCVPFAWLLMTPYPIKQFGDSLASVTLFISNFLFWYEDDYFAPVSAQKPLLHTWSLSVEEQFYFLFPLLLLGIWRFGRRPTLIILTCTAILSLALSQWSTTHAQSANFYLAPTRAWELLVGAICAILANNKPASSSLTLASVGLLAILVPIYVYNDNTPFPSLYALAPTLGTSLVIMFARPSNFIGLLLGSRPFVAIGLISYSTYLWHQPILAFERLYSGETPSQIRMLFLVALCLCAGFMSWFFIEKPFRDRNKVASRTLLKVLFAGMLLSVGLSGFLHINNGWEKIWLNQRTPVARQVFILMENARKHDDTEAADQNKCRFNVRDLNSKVIDRITNCYAQYGKGLLLIGDSHGIDLYGLEIARNPHPFIVGVTKGYCRPSSADISCPFDRITSYISHNPIIFNRIVFEQAGFYLLRKANDTDRRQMLLGLPLNLAVTGIFLDQEEIAKSLEYLANLSQFVPLTWLGPRYDPMISLQSLMRHGCSFPYKARPGQEAIYKSLDEEIARQASAVPNMNYISQMKTVNLSHEKDLMNCNVSFWTDSDHYSAAGEKRFGKRIPLFDTRIAQ